MFLIRYAHAGYTVNALGTLTLLHDLFTLNYSSCPFTACPIYNA